MGGSPVTDAPRHRSLASSAGVTLIELMIVLIVISIGLLALSGVQTSSSRDVDSVGRRSRALDVAQNQMEVARAAGFTSSISDSGSVDSIFTWKTQVAQQGTNVGLKTVTVTVAWTEKGEPQSVQLDDLLSTR